jgi:DNA topoisomerase-6 subunit B
LSQPGGSGLPRGPAIFLVHICSTWVPFTSESKEAVASYPEIQREVRLAILECARQVLSFIRRQRRAKREKYRMQRFMDYLPLIAESACKLAGRKKKIDINPVLNLVVKKRLLHVKNSE